MNKMTFRKVSGEDGILAELLKQMSDEVKTNFNKTYDNILQKRQEKIKTLGDKSTTYPNSKQAEKYSPSQL